MSVPIKTKVCSMFPQRSHHNNSRKMKLGWHITSLIISLVGVVGMDDLVLSPDKAEDLMTLVEDSVKGDGGSRYKSRRRVRLGYSGLDQTHYSGKPDDRGLMSECSRCVSDCAEEEAGDDRDDLGDCLVRCMDRGDCDEYPGLSKVSKSRARHVLEDRERVRMAILKDQEAKKQDEN